jgi:hypothetical protein
MVCAIFFVPSAMPAISARVSPCFRCLRRCRFPQGSELPRWLLLPPASPAIRTSGCPSFRTSGFTGDRSSSRLDSLSFGGAGCESSRLPLRFAPPVSPTISIQVAPDPHPPAPAGQLSESPRIRSIRFALFESPDCSVDSLRTSSIDQSPSRPGSCSLNVADSVRSESPRNFLPQLIRICFRRLRLLPHVRLCR